ncbi:hypothetical protein ACOSQ4_028145 [Xanthoceras sorbifolium]
MRIQKLFADEVLLPELQSLLTLLLQKFQREWHEEVIKDKVTSCGCYQFEEFRDILDTMLRSLSNMGEISNTQLPQETNTV